jgi:hypothetical protein
VAHSIDKIFHRLPCPNDERAAYKSCGDPEFDRDRLVAPLGVGSSHELHVSATRNVGKSFFEAGTPISSLAMPMSARVAVRDMKCHRPMVLDKSESADVLRLAGPSLPAMQFIIRTVVLPKRLGEINTSRSDKILLESTAVSASFKPILSFFL